MNPEKLEGLFGTEHIDAVQAALIELKAVDKKRLKERMERVRPLIKRGSLIGHIVGFREWFCKLFV